MENINEKMSMVEENEANAIVGKYISYVEELKNSFCYDCTDLNDESCQFELSDIVERIADRLESLLNDNLEFGQLND